MPMHVRHGSKKMVAPFCFALSLLLLFILSLVGIFISSGPVVLGSEMNANGTIEYLCLGTGCESHSELFFAN